MRWIRSGIADWSVIRSWVQTHSRKQCIPSVLASRFDQCEDDPIARRVRRQICSGAFPFATGSIGHHRNQAHLPERFFNRLVNVGLVEPRISADELDSQSSGGIQLKEFLDVFISRRKTLKERVASIETVKKWQGTRDLLLQCFDDERSVDSFKLADARKFRQWLESRRIPKSKRNSTGKMAENSIRQRIANCKTFFSYAEQEELIEANPFRTQVSSTQDTEKGKLRIAAEVIDKVIAVAPDAQWKLLIALWRFAGLRKMEPMHLQWDDVCLLYTSDAADE